MADYGVVNSGFVRKRLSEQLQEIIAEIKAGFGEDVVTTPDTVFGILSSITAERFSAIWEEMEDIYHQMYPMSATGSNLDRAVSFTGVTRLQEQPSVARVVWYGKEGTVVPDYTTVRNKETRAEYFSEGETTISKSNAYDVELTCTLSDIAYNQVISVIVDGISYSYQTDRESLIYAIKNLAHKLSDIPYLDVKYTDSTISLTATSVTGFSLEEGSDFGITKIGTSGTVSTEGPSLDEANAGAISEIIKMTTGVDSVVNLNKGSQGRHQETDAQLYQRYHLGVYRTGGGTAESIRANILELHGVNSCTVYQNTEQATDSAGVPPASIHVVVKGGLDDDIAKTILDTKAAGIGTFGTKELSVKDSQCVSHLIRFSRPKKAYIWCRVRVNTFVDQNESVKNGYLLKTIEKILEYGQEMEVGSDVILQRIMAKCVSLDGISSVNIELGKTYSLTEDEPIYSAGDIKILAGEEAVFHKSIIRIS